MQIVPDKTSPRWLYNILRSLGEQTAQHSTALTAVARGEAPDGSGVPLIDTSRFFLLPGRDAGQIGFGSTAPDGNLTLSSTADANKGFIYLGSPTRRLTIDEDNGYVGINTASPTVALHIVGTATGGGTQNTSSDIANNWAGPYTGGGTPIGGTSAAALASNDGTTSYMACLEGVNGVNPQKNGLNGTIQENRVYTVTISFFTLSGTFTAGTVRVSLVTSLGNRYESAPFDPVGLSTTPTTIIFTVTTSGTPASTGDTANAVWLGAVGNQGITGLYCCISYVEVVSAGDDITRWYAADGSPLLSYVDSGGSFHMPQITLTTGAGATKWLQSSSDGLGVWTSPAALTKTDDTNVTLTLGGSHATSLLNAASLTLGWTGQLSIARGGTGQSTALAAFNALSPLTTLGDILYNDGTDDVRLAGNATATRKFLRQTGTGSVSAAPVWDTLLITDVLTPSATYTLSNVTTDRSFNADSTSLDELADVLSTVIGDLRAQGILT